MVPTMGNGQLTMDIPDNGHPTIDLSSQMSTLIPAMSASDTPDPAAHKLTLDDARHVAKLSRLALPEEKLRQLTPQLEAILEYVATISEVNVEGVEPMAHATPLSNVLRDDVVQPALTNEQALRNAPETDGPFFKVPKVLGGDEDSAG